MAFPMVNAAKIVPTPRPLLCPKNIPVIPAVTIRQIISKKILILEYLIPVICASLNVHNATEHSYVKE